MAEIKKTLYIEDGVLKDLEQDIFGHKHIADAVVQSIIQTNPPFTIGIFGGWGTGKSSLLELIKADLSKNNIVTATIDAWRYSSSDNLRRAFLVHVANELTPGLLDELRRKLFSSEEEIVPFQPSQIDLSEKTLAQKFKDWLLTVFRLASKFVGLLILLFLLVFVVFSIILVLENSGFKGFWVNFNWSDFKEKFFDLAFIPLLLAVLDDVRLYYVQKPVTVVHERIDADELFSQYFDKVVAKKADGFFAKKRLVIFVDNLDRLGDEKMVEALEGLKTYLNNPNCVFVVACDDNVVRSVINNSEKIPNIDTADQNGGRAGEHYLDKFFQQTFRLPEYMGFNLHDFAMRNFKTTKIYDELVSQNVDVGYLVSIILPSHINSPRKVKRLLNEFIALYEIVKKRESGEGGQLRPGQLSANVEVLGKFSTLRAEYPEFYQLLIKSPGLLQSVTESIQQPIVESGGQPSQLNNIPNSERLSSYLRKTESILIDDIDSYIWLSQDSLSLGLPSNIVNQLRVALVNNDASRFSSILNETSNKEEKIRITQVAYRIAQSLAGIEQQNGVKVLAYLLPSFDDLIKTEVAHVVADMMTRRLEEFSAREMLNVLRWAKRGGIETQRQKLIKQVVGLLYNEGTRRKTFNAILENADVVDQYGATVQTNTWLAAILQIENQTVPSTPDGVDINFANREFAEWLISQIETYSDNKLVVDNYFSQDLIEYLVLRIFGKELGLNGVYLSEEGLGENINKIFQVLARRVRGGASNSRYWNGVIKIVGKAEIVEDLKYGINEVNNSIDFVPTELMERFVCGGFEAVDRLFKKSGEDKIEDQELIDVLDQVVGLTYNLRSKKKESFELNKLESLPSTLSILFEQLIAQDAILDFVDQFSRRFGGKESETLVSGLLLVLSKPDPSAEIDDKVINKIINLDNYVANENRSKVLDRLNTLVSSNDQDKIARASALVERIVILTTYHEQLKILAQSWLEKFEHGDLNISRVKTNLFDTLIKNDLLLGDAYIDRIIALYPFGENQKELQIVFDEVEKISSYISTDKGKALFSIVLAHVAFLGTKLPKSLGVVSAWRNAVDDAERSNYDSNIISLFISAPNAYLPIHLISWSGLTSVQLQEYIVQICRGEIGDELKNNRDFAVKNAFEAIEMNERKGIASMVWSQLVNDRDAAEAFMNVVKEVLSQKDIVALRADSINSVRDNESETNLRLLAVTARRGLGDRDEIVSLFENLFGRGADVVQKALKYVVQCVKPLNLKKEHEYTLAEAMSNALASSDEEIRAIEDKAEELGLKWFKHKKK